MTLLQAKTTCWDRVASGISGKLDGVTRFVLEAHLGEGKLTFNPCRFAYVSPCGKDFMR